MIRCEDVGQRQGDKRLEGVEYGLMKLCFIFEWDVAVEPMPAVAVYCLISWPPIVFELRDQSNSCRWFTERQSNGTWYHNKALGSQ
jgi:hypothetical protein